MPQEAERGEAENETLSNLQGADQSYRSIKITGLPPAFVVDAMTAELPKAAFVATTRFGECIHGRHDEKRQICSSLKVLIAFPESIVCSNPCKEQH